VLVEFTATSRPEVASFVLSFGPEAELLAPEDLRAEVAGMIRQMAAIYG
jgi:predicted DNA-binding transcriptional regulator YafY